MIFLAISIWNVFVKRIIITVVESISFDSKIHRSLYLYVILITSCGVQARGHPSKRMLGLTLFRPHLSKFLSSVGSIFGIFRPLQVQFLKFTSVLSQVLFQLL